MHDEHGDRDGALAAVETGLGDRGRAASVSAVAYHLRAGSHLVIAGSRHEILQEQDRYRGQFWAAFDAFVPGTPLFK